MNSALYEGRITHRRVIPRHSFTYRVAMPLIDLTEIDEVVARHPLWSRERRNAVCFRRGDFLGDPHIPLDRAVQDLVESRTGTRPGGPVLMLAHLRTWGWLFNPIALYLCMDTTMSVVEAVVAQVTNTPWHETHVYVLPGSGEHRFAKELHVSPFFGMEQTYRWQLRFTGEDMVVQLDNEENGETVFHAVMSLRRRELSRSSMGRLLWRFPILTLRVSGAIYLQALRLLLKGASPRPHPSTLKPACPRPHPRTAANVPTRRR